MTRSTLIGLLAVAASQVTDKYVELNKEIELTCSGLDKPITWSYAPNIKDALNNDLNVFYTSGKFSFHHPQVQHLEEQVSGLSDSNLLISPIAFTVNGVFRCRSWSSSKTIDYSLTVYSIPSARITTEDNFLVKDQVSSVTCNVEGGEPSPDITWFVNGSPVSEDSIINTKKADVFSSITTIESTAQITVTNSGEVSVECKISSQGLPEEFAYEGTTAQKVFQVQSAPSAVSFSRTVVSNDGDQFILCEAESTPIPEFEWKLGAAFKNFSTIDDNRLTLSNVPLNLNGTEITCIAKNRHGSSQTKEIIFVVDGSLSDKSTFTSNKILFVGIIVAIVVLALIGGIVAQRRCSQQTHYNTNEDKHRETPDGISYEQNPEREALAPDERNVQKELLM